ncbi:hypothetical protein RchiOBHm_Chr2g0139651 [Rosa chinensis]|uniref:Uncharacterized protein n=1 Tax=Rosa chinensis TaxID=74649 RepID=A0A2P6RX55_ROSCH|nr:hypothetical protein RchiOBHm_Chr2g0139651 [Rosa chinensis]
MVIWYEMLFSFNRVSKVLQSNDMQISVAIAEVKGLIAWLDKFRETGFIDAMITAKEIAAALDVDPIFLEKRPIQITRFFYESTVSHLHHLQVRNLSECIVSCIL